MTWRQTSSLPYLLCRLNLFLSENTKSIFNASFSPILPLPLPLLTSKPTAAQHAATVAAVQALITHVQSPLPMGGCVTPVDHFAVLFLFRLWPRTLDYTTRNKKRKRKEKKTLFSFRCCFYMSSRAPFPALRFMLSHRLHLSKRLHSTKRCLEWSPARLQEVVKQDSALSERLDAFRRLATCVWDVESWHLQWWAEGFRRRRRRLVRRIFPFSFSSTRGCYKAAITGLLKRIAVHCYVELLLVLQWNLSLLTKTCWMLFK